MCHPGGGICQTGKNMSPIIFKTTEVNGEVKSCLNERLKV